MSCKIQYKDQTFDTAEELFDYARKNNILELLSVLPPEEVVDSRSGALQTLLERNTSFNEDLARFVKGLLPAGYALNLGRPGAIIKQAGLEDLPIKLSAALLKDKSTQPNHPFNPIDLINLVKKMNFPVAMMVDPKNAHAVTSIVDLRDSRGRYYTLAIGLQNKGDHYEVVTIFPRNDDNKMFNLIAEGLPIYMEKFKALKYLQARGHNALSQSSSIPKALFDKVKQRIESFKNRVTEESVREWKRLFQLDEEDMVIERNIEQLDRMLLDFLKAFGVKSKEFENLKDRLGVDALGATDILNKLIWYKKARNIETLPEEAAHMIVALMGEGHPEINELMEDITSWSEYEKIARKYRPIYKNEKQVKIEAIGKLIAKALVKNYKATNGADQSLIEKARKVIEDFLSAVWSTVESFVNNIVLNKNFNYSYHLADKIALNILAGNREYVAPTKPEGVQVDYEAALADNPLAAGLIEDLTSNFNTLLVGSIAIAGQGAEIYRSEQETIHDLDFRVNNPEEGEKIIEYLESIGAVPAHFGWRNNNAEYTTAAYYVPRKGLKIAEVYRKANGWATAISLKDENGNPLEEADARDYLSIDLFIYDNETAVKSVKHFISVQDIYAGKLGLSPLGANERFFQRDKDQRDYQLHRPKDYDVVRPQFVYYQLNESKEDPRNKDLVDKLNQTSKTVINKEKEDGDNAYFIGDREVKRRVTSFIKTLIKNKFFRNRVVTEAQQAFEDQTKTWGRAGHEDMQYLIKKYTTEAGTVTLDKEGRPMSHREDSNYKSKVDPENKGIFKKLDQYVQNLLAEYPEGTVFRVEQTIYAEKRDMAGTMDFVAILPDGKKDILDWKFTRVNKKKGDDIPWYKQEEWNLQMNEYKKILKSDYGQTDKDFRRTRMIPIVLEYKSKKVAGKDEYFPAKAEMSDIKIRFGEKSYLLPVPTADETTGNKKLDNLLNSLRTLYQTIKDIPATDNRRDLKNKQLNSLFTAIRHLQVEQNFAPLVDQIKVLVEETNRVIDRYQADFAGKDFTSISEEEISDQAATLLLKAQALHLYQNLDVKFFNIYGDNPTEEQKKVLDSLATATKEARTAYNRVETVSEGFTEKYITSRRGIEGILDPEKTVTGLTRNFGLTSELPTAALRTLYRMVDIANNKVHFDMREAMEELVEIENEVSEWNKGKDPTAFAKLIKKKSGKKNKKGEDIYSNELIDEFQEEFYKKLKEAIEREDWTWVKDNIDLEKFKKELDRQKERGEKYLEDVVFSSDPAEQNKKLKEAKEQLQRRTDYTKKEAFLEYYNAKKFPIAKWQSAEFQELQRNAPVLKFYNFIKKWNERAYGSGYLAGEQFRTFLPFVHKSFSEKIALGGEFSTADWVASNLTMNENTEGYGNFNPLTGQMEDSVPVYFTTEIDNPELISEDLFKNMALFARSVINYEQKTAIDGQVKMLYFIEKNKSSLQTNKWGKLIRGDVGDQAQEVASNERNANLLLNHIKVLQYGQKYSDTESTDALLGKAGQSYNNFVNKVNTKLGFNILPKVNEGLAENQISATKLIDTINKVFTLKSMGLNLATSVSVLAGGNFQAIINSGKYYTKEQFLSSEFQHAGHKVFKNNYQLQMALIKSFMPIDEEMQREINRLSLSKVNSQNFSEFMMVLMRKADHLVQYANFLSFMKNTIVIDGKLYNAREYYRTSPEYTKRYQTGFPQEERRRMEKEFESKVDELLDKHGLLKLASVDEKGNLKIEGIDTLKNESVFRYRSIINTVGRKATGNISPDNEMLMRMNAIYRSMLVFKNWIPGLVKQRFAGLRYDAATETWEQGRMNMIFRHLGPLAMFRIRDIMDIMKGTDRGVELVKRFYEKQKAAYEESTNKTLEDLTEEEYIDMFRQALKSQMKELVILTSLLVLAFGVMPAMKPDDDDDKEAINQWKFAYRMMDKVKDEVWFYYNPTQMQQILNGNIFPAMGVFTDMFKMTGSVLKETAGIVVGDDGIVENTYPIKNIMKSFPLTKEAVYYIALFDADLAKELGIQLTTESRMR